MGLVGPRWAPCWPHEPCHQGVASLVHQQWTYVVWNWNSHYIRFLSNVNTQVKNLHQGALTILGTWLRMKFSPFCRHGLRVCKLHYINESFGEDTDLQRCLPAATNDGITPRASCLIKRHYSVCEVLFGFNRIWTENIWSRSSFSILHPLLN